MPTPSPFVQKLVDIQSLIDEDEYEDALDKLDSLIKDNGTSTSTSNTKQSDIDSAQYARAYCLVKSGDFDEAIERCDDYLKSHKDDMDIDSSSISLTQSFLGLKAYSLYSLNKFTECLDILAHSKQQFNTASPTDDFDDLASHLKAQCCYRNGDYKMAYDVYSKLMNIALNKSSDKKDMDSDDNMDTDEGYDLLEEILVNLTAASVSSGQSNRVAKQINEAKQKTNTSELGSEWVIAFNQACAFIQASKFDQAMEELERASKLIIQEAEENGDEPGSQDGIMAVIDAQKAVVLQKMGKKGEAKHECSKLLTGKKLDLAGSACVTANLAVLKEDGSKISEGLTALPGYTEEALKNKLITRQVSQIALNTVLLFAKKSKFNEAKKALDQLRSLLSSTGSSTSSSSASSSSSTVGSSSSNSVLPLLEAAICFFEKRIPDAEKILLEASNSDSSSSAEALQALGELYASPAFGNDTEKSLACYRRLPASHRLNALDAICRSNLKNGNYEKIVDDLQGSVLSLAESPKLGDVLKIAAKWSLILKDHTFAAETFQTYLEQIDSKDSTMTIGLALALSKQEPERTIKMLTKSKITSELWREYDGEELELVVPKRTAQTASTVVGGGPDSNNNNTTTSSSSDKTKRKRKPRYPKNFDPKNPGPPPDPERWLPKYERSTYKNKKGKKGGANFRGPQGAGGGVDTEVRKGNSTLHQEIASETVARKGNKNKKKKK